jgi:hypothetical protein
MCEAFAEIAALASRLGIASIGKLPGCWEHRIDDHWWIAVNGHPAVQKSSTGKSVPPFSAYVEFCGWPAGIVNPYGGLIAAGDAANEDTFIAALRAA